MKKIAAISLLCMSSSLVTAQEYYGSIAYSMLDSELSLFGISQLDSEPTAVKFSVGKPISDKLSVEVALATGISDDDVGSIDAKFKLDQLVSVYGIGVVPISEEFNLYGKLGLAIIEFDDVDSLQSDGTGISYGFGGEMRFSKKFGAAIEYIIYPDAEYDDIDVEIETSSLDLKLKVYF